MVTLSYEVDTEDLVPFDGRGKDWECTQVGNSDRTKCKQIVHFEDLNEWSFLSLLDGRHIDVHLDYVPSAGFDSEEDWLKYIIQAYEYIDEEPQLYDNQLIEKVTLEKY